MKIECGKCRINNEDSLTSVVWVVRCRMSTRRHFTKVFRTNREAITAPTMELSNRHKGLVRFDNSPSAIGRFHQNFDFNLSENKTKFRLETLPFHRLEHWLSEYTKTSKSKI